MPCSPWVDCLVPLSWTLYSLVPEARAVFSTAVASSSPHSKAPCLLPGYQYNEITWHEWGAERGTGSCIWLCLLQWLPNHIWLNEVSPCNPTLMAMKVARMVAMPNGGAKKVRDVIGCKMACPCCHWKLFKMSAREYIVEPLTTL